MGITWVKMRAGLESTIEVARLSVRLGITIDAAVMHLFNLAGWFATQGDYGKMKLPPVIVDAFLKVPGFASELVRVGWLACHENGILTLRGFCKVSTDRKSIGQKLRRKILSSGVCAACGRPDSLQIDHKTPVSRGGSCKDDNLQALCASCNLRKGTKTMEEFLG